jgi:hypothetical protein
VVCVIHAAHPDDENTRLLFTANDKKYEPEFTQPTRGDDKTWLDPTVRTLWSDKNTRINGSRKIDGGETVTAK